jgi:hypothetical protein
LSMPICVQAGTTRYNALLLVVLRLKRLDEDGNSTEEDSSHSAVANNGLEACTGLGVLGCGSSSSDTTSGRGSSGSSRCSRGTVERRTMLRKLTGGKEMLTTHAA